MIFVRGFKYKIIIKESQVTDSPHIQSFRGVLNHILSQTTIHPFNEFLAQTYL